MTREEGRTPAQIDDAAKWIDLADEQLMPRVESWLTYRPAAERDLLKVGLALALARDILMFGDVRRKEFILLMATTGKTAIETIFSMNANCCDDGKLP